MTEKQVAIEELTKQINDLSLLVKKQSQVLSKTGQQVISLQIEKEKEFLNPKNAPTSPKGKSLRGYAPSIDTSDFATNEDLVQLVGELQGQLELIEERSIRRLINSKKSPTEILAPLLNADGEEPPLEHFPKSAESFTKISDASLVNLAKFYDLLPPTPEERERFEEFVEGKSQSLETVEVDASKYSKDDLDDAFDSLARFLGLSVRRNVDAW